MNFYKINDTTIKAVFKSREGKKFVAVAKCNPEDEFDFDIGCRIAEQRVIKKLKLFRLEELTRKEEELKQEIFEKLNQYNKLVEKRKEVFKSVELTDKRIKFWTE